MKIGNQIRGFSITFDRGIISINWWGPVKPDDIPAHERERMKLTGSVSRSQRMGPVTFTTSYGKAAPK